MLPRVVAIIATYNESRFIAGCLEHLFTQGVEAYLCDNDSTDDTVAIASRYLGSGLRGIERIPRDGTFRWREILQREPQIDVIVRGEGERTCVALFRALQDGGAFVRAHTGR